MHKNEINIIFGMARRKSTTKEYVCQIVGTPQGSNDFALFLLFFLYLRGNFLKINEPKTLTLHLAYISEKTVIIILF